MLKSYKEINKKIKNNNCKVVTAEEIIKIAQENSIKKTAEEVDIVTTATFGTMCSSGIYLNFGHSDPPIKFQKAWLNDIPLYCGFAAVDAFLGATQLDENNNLKYGGSHVISDLLKGKDLHLKAIGFKTDCYPRKKIDTYISIDDINQAVMLNLRNSYQNYAVATNSTDKKIYTYMGKLLPNFGNVTYSSAGELNPLINDPYYQTIGLGTRIFLGGSQGYISWEGTQFNSKAIRAKNGVPKQPAGSLSVIADLKKMNKNFINPVCIPKYGVSLNVGLGVPIPILNEEILKFTLVKNCDIFTKIYDYGIGSRNRPIVAETNYEAMRRGYVKINGEEVPAKPLSNIKKAREIVKILKNWIAKGDFRLSRPLQFFPQNKAVKPLQVRKKRGEQ